MKPNKKSKLNKPLNEYKSKLLKTSATLGLLGLTGFSNVAYSDEFQVAVIEHTPGAKEIIEGQYASSVKKLTKMQSNKQLSFNKSLSLCAANIMLNKYQAADSACTAAIEKYQNKTGFSYKYFKSIAYNNRGIAKYLQGDKTGASLDLETAASIDKNRIVMANLTKLKEKIDVNYEELTEKLVFQN